MTFTFLNAILKTLKGNEAALQYCCCNTDLDIMNYTQDAYLSGF